MRKSSTACSLVLAGFIIATAAPVRAEIISNYTFPDGGAGFALNTNSSILTGIRIGFYPPQPIYPPSPVMSFSEPTAPLLTQPDSCPCSFEMSLLGLGIPEIQFPPQPIYPPNPIFPPTPIFSQDAANFSATSFSFSASNHNFIVDIGFANPHPIISWYGFNPSVNPPVSFFAGAVDFSNPGDPLVVISIFEDNTALQFSPASAVPETSIWAMLLLGFAGVGLMAYRRRGRAVLAA